MLIKESGKMIDSLATVQNRRFCFYHSTTITSSQIVLLLDKTESALLCFV